jgi:hypothetical protein
MIASIVADNVSTRGRIESFDLGAALLGRRGFRVFWWFRGAGRAPAGQGVPAGAPTGGLGRAGLIARDSGPSWLVFALKLPLGAGWSSRLSSRDPAVYCPAQQDRGM